MKPADSEFFWIFTNLPMFINLNNIPRPSIYMTKILLKINTGLNFYIL